MLIYLHKSIFYIKSAFEMLKGVKKEYLKSLALIASKEPFQLIIFPIQ